MKRTIGINDMHYIHTWIDSSYTAYKNMRGHSGGIICMGKCALIHNCDKQKINTKSSTESEIVGVLNAVVSPDTFTLDISSQRTN